MAQQIDAEALEVLVVDNGGFPETQNALDSYHGRFPFKFRVIRENKLGLSQARNRALAEAAMPVVAFIDDDAVAEPLWARGLLSAFEDSDVWAAGGPVQPKWECERPKWLIDRHLRSLSVVSWGSDSRWLTWPERVIGTNMAFRTTEIVKLGGFDVNYGRKGEGMGGMEDTLPQKIMSERGRATYYVAGAVVFHLVPKERCRLSYFFKRSYGHTMSELKTRKGQVAQISLLANSIPRICYYIILYLWACFARPKNRIWPTQMLASNLAKFKYSIIKK